MKRNKLLTLFAAFAMVATVSAQVTYTCTAGTNYDGNEGVAKLFDGNENTKFCGNTGADVYALFTASEPVYAWGYDMTTANDNEAYGRLLKQWTLYGTNDAEVGANPDADGWVVLSDLGENNLVQKKNFFTQRFFCEKNVNKSFKYFKLALTGGGFVQFSEFKLLGEPNRVTTYKWKASSQDNSKKALDLLLGQKWEGSNIAGNWVTIETGDGQAYAVKSYSFSTHDDGDWNDRAPKSWKIEGSNDNSNWTLIDQVVDDEVIQNANYTTFEFTPSNTTDKFRYIRLTLDKMKADGWTQVGEFHVLSTSDVSDAQYYTNLVNTAKATKAEYESLLGENDPWCQEYATFFEGLDLDGVLAAAISAGDYASLEAKLAEAENNAVAQAIKLFANGANYAAIAGSGDKCWGDGHYSQLFDGKDGCEGRLASKWGGNNFPQYVIFRVKEAFKPFFYKLVTGNDTANNTGRNWKTWNVYGGNFASFSAAADSSAAGWTLIDAREDISEEYLPMKNFYPATFDFNKGVSEDYLYYMVIVNAPHSGTQQQMSEMYLCTQEEFEAIREPLVAAFEDFDAAGLTVLPEDEEAKASFGPLFEELKTTADAVRLTKVYNDLVALREKLEASAAFAGGGYRSVSGNTAWGDGENWTKLIDGDPSTKWGGGRPEGGSYNIFKSYVSVDPEYYMLITGNDTQRSPDRNWARWKIYGGNFDSDEAATRDAEGWVLIDSKEDIGQDLLPGANFAPAYFSVDGDWEEDGFNYFKIEVDSAYNGGGSIQMSEFRFLDNSEWKDIRAEYADSLNTLKAEIFEGKEISDAVAADVDAAINAFKKVKPEQLLTNFAKACKMILDAPMNSTLELAAGDADCILPSMKWGGAYKAWTYVAQGEFDYGDWNESNPNYNKIIGVPAKQDGKAWYQPDFNVAAWNYGQDLPNFGDGRPADVYAIRYFTVDGEIPSTVYMPAPHDDAPCEYYINGELIWAETDGWYEDEVVRLTDSQKALIKTDGSVNVFAFHVHQNWGGRYADGGLYTAGDMVNAFNGDALRALDATIALAESDSIDADIIEFAKSKSNYRNGHNKGLAQLRKARRLAADARTENFVGTAPADGMEVFIFNVGAKMFLAGGNDWGTHASLNHMGTKCVLRANSSGENRYSIKTNLPNGSRNDYDGLGHNGYVDCKYGDDFTTAQGWAWTFEALEDGSYHIINADNSLYLGMTDDDRLQVDTDKSGADNPYNKWLLVTPDEFMALAVEATAENPVDLGHLIHQATFSQNDFDGNDKGAANADLNDSKWERNAGSIFNWKGNDVNGDYMFEMWNTASAGKVYLKQVVEGLPAGKYTVSMTGYYRDGNFESADEGNVRQLAFLYAGTEYNKVLLPSIVEGSGNCPGYGRGGASGIVIPDGCRDAAKFFQVGTYTTTIDANVREDGKLEIGVYRDAEDVKGGDWIVTDNWRLYYKGNPVDVAVSEYGYATFVAPGYIETVPEGVEAFAAQVKEGYVHLEPTTAIPAGEAVVLKAEEGTYTMYQKAKEANLALENDLIAATDAVTADGSQYILAKLEDEVGFAKATPETKIVAGKGYLVIPAAVKAFYPFTEEAETGINDLKDVKDLNGAIYNLSGQRVNKAQKGIYIINGKKVLK